MTHLKIEQDTGTRETVASSVIKKLYDLAKEIKLDANGTIALKGWLYTSATYQDYITYLQNISKVNGEPQLTIDATKKYIMFEDSAVQSVLATTYGDGIGVTQNELTSVSEIQQLFKNNTDITKFNEFKYFTGITTPAVSWLSDWFSGCTNLTEITIPKNVRSITKAAFLGCTSLHTVTFDTGSVAESISGFKNCSSLTNIQLPNTVQTLGQDCFSGCTSLTSLNTSNITSIDRGAFGGSGITTIDLSNVTSFGDYAFQGCRQLSSIGSLSTNVTTIGIEGFSNCSSLVINNLSLPHLTTLGESVFVNAGIKQVSNLGLITSIPYSTFYGCTQLTSVTLPLTVTSIGVRAFSNCSALTSIDLSNITSIGNQAFNGCSSLTNINISSIISTIESSVFNGCSNLQCIDLSNITSLGDSSFGNCIQLVDLSTNDINNINIGSDTYTFNWATIQNSCFYNVPLTNKSLILPELLYVGQNTFQYSSVISLNMPKFIKTNGGWSFCNNTHLQTVTFGDAITSLGAYSFAGDTSLTTVTFGANSSFSLGGQCFDGCTNLTTLTNITNCTKLANLVFRNCSNLGNNETLELNLTDQDSNPEESLSNTKYKRLILHWPNSIPNGWRSHYPLWSYMAQLEYLDISDTKWGVDHRGNNSRALTFYGNTNIKTVILSPDYNYIWSSKNIFYQHPGFQHLIILNDSVIEIESSSNDRFFEANYAPQLNIYVLDSLLSSYLADATWSQIPNMSSHLKGLSDLPAGVWTTGLASQYLTPAQLATS